MRARHTRTPAETITITWPDTARKQLHDLLKHTNKTPESSRTHLSTIIKDLQAIFVRINIHSLNQRTYDQLAFLVESIETALAANQLSNDDDVKLLISVLEPYIIRLQLIAQIAATNKVTYKNVSEVSNLCMVLYQKLADTLQRLRK